MTVQSEAFARNLVALDVSSDAPHDRPLAAAEPSQRVEPPPAPGFGRRSTIVVGLTLLGAAFRFWGLRWGAPERFDFYIDETRYVIRHALAVSLSNPEPRFLNYPSFLAYTIAIAKGLFSRLGADLQPWEVHLLGRGIVALYGTATVPMAFLLVESAGAPLAAATLAGLWVAILPGHIWESHVAVTDGMMTFWVVSLLVACARAEKSPTLRRFAVCGAALGLAVGSKYTAALAAVAPLLVVLRSKLTFRRRAVTLCVLTATALAACFVVTPYSFLRPERLLAGLAFESAHVRGDHPGFSLPAPGIQYHRYVYQLMAAFPFQMGFALYASAIVGVAWLVRCRRREALIPLVVAGAFLLVTGSFRFTPLRYYLPIVLVLAVAAGWWQGSWFVHRSRVRKVVAWVSVAVTLGYTSVFAYQTTSRYSHDTRIQAAQWITRHMRGGERIVAVGNPAYLALPVCPSSEFSVIENGRALRLGAVNGADWLEITGMTYLRGFRQGRPGFVGDYARLRRGRAGYRLVRSFQGTFVNRDVYRRLDPMFEGYFVSPTIEIYARNR